MIRCVNFSNNSMIFSRTKKSKMWRWMINRMRMLLPLSPIEYGYPILLYSTYCVSFPILPPGVFLTRLFVDLQYFWRSLFQCSLYAFDPSRFTAKTAGLNCLSVNSPQWHIHWFHVICFCIASCCMFEEGNKLELLFVCENVLWIWQELRQWEPKGLEEIFYWDHELNWKVEMELGEESITKNSLIFERDLLEFLSHWSFHILWDLWRRNHHFQYNHLTSLI